MSIGAANLFTRNFWKAYINPNVDDAGEASVAKIASLIVKIGALLVILYLPTQFALDLQLLGGLWILQVFPAVVFCLFTRWFVAPALLAGWAVGLIGGTYLSWADGLKPLHLVTLGGHVSFTAYVGLIALIANIVTAVVVNAILMQTRKPSHAFRGAP
jgi:SSS family solute:Na+ symporter